ncbi:MAG: hypothetical protein ACI9G1_001763, partial [Pirellulaceae bacterium]
RASGQSTQRAIHSTGNSLNGQSTQRAVHSTGNSPIPKPCFIAGLVRIAAPNGAIWPTKPLASKPSEPSKSSSVRRWQPKLNGEFSPELRLTRLMKVVSVRGIIPNFPLGNENSGWTFGVLFSTNCGINPVHAPIRVKPTSAGREFMVIYDTRLEFTGSFLRTFPGRISIEH